MNGLEALKGINTIINKAIEKDLLTLKGSIKLIGYSSIIKKDLEEYQKLKKESESTILSQNNHSSNLEDLLKELGYEKATYETEKNREFYFKNRYGFFDIVITHNKLHNFLYFEVMRADTPAFWLSKIKKIQKEMLEDFNFIKTKTNIECRKD